jgi:hypothetical protein
MKKSVSVIAGVIVLFLIAGCSPRQMVTNEIAKKIVGVLDTQYVKNLKNAPAKNAGAAQYCLSVSVPIVSAVKTSEYMLNGYRTSVQGFAAGEGIANDIGTLQTNLKDCAYVRCKNAAGVDVAALRNLAGVLGINAGAEPPKDSCKKYEKLSGEINKKISK